MLRSVIDTPYSIDTQLWQLMKIFRSKCLVLNDSSAVICASICLLINSSIEYSLFQGPQHKLACKMKVFWCFAYSQVWNTILVLQRNYGIREADGCPRTPGAMLWWPFHYRCTVMYVAVSDINYRVDIGAEDKDADEESDEDLLQVQSLHTLNQPNLAMTGWPSFKVKEKRSWPTACSQSFR